MTQPTPLDEMLDNLIAKLSQRIRDELASDLHRVALVLRDTREQIRRRAVASETEPAVVSDAAKISLADLDRKAQRASGGQWHASHGKAASIVMADDHPVDGREWQVADCYDNTRWTEAQCVANAEHVAANSPPVTLALVAVAAAALEVERLDVLCAALPVDVRGLQRRRAEARDALAVALRAVTL